MVIAACNQYKNFNGIFYIDFPTKSLKFGVRFALTLRLHSGRPHAARGYDIGQLRPKGFRANFLQRYAVFITIWLLYFFLLMTQGYLITQDHLLFPTHLCSSPSTWNALPAVPLLGLIGSCRFC